VGVGLPGRDHDHPELREPGRTPPPGTAWFAGHSEGPAAVARLLPNPFGLFDMHGNVSEWCHNRSKPSIREALEFDAEDVLDEHYRAVRGGRPSSYAVAIRSSRRVGDRPALLDSGGFRVARGSP